MEALADPDDNSTWVSPTRALNGSCRIRGVVQYYLDRGEIDDAAGKAFCFDWESHWLRLSVLVLSSGMIQLTLSTEPLSLNSAVSRRLSTMLSR